MTRRKGKCASSGKVAHANLIDAKATAKSSHVQSIASGVLVGNLYAYICPWCNRWHLTRDERHNGVYNAVAKIAPPLNLQLWAMGRSLAEKAEANLAKSIAGDQETRRRYVNRPRVLKKAR